MCKPGNYCIDLGCRDVAFASALPSMFCRFEGVSGATTTRVASAAAMCLSNVLLIFMSKRRGLGHLKTTGVSVALVSIRKALQKVPGKDCYVSDLVIDPCCSIDVVLLKALNYLLAALLVVLV